jgi:hypothetical protein
VLDLRNNQGRVDIHLAGRGGGPAREADLMAIQLGDPVWGLSWGPERLQAASAVTEVGRTRSVVWQCGTTGRRSGWTRPPRWLLEAARSITDFEALIPCTGR